MPLFYCKTVEDVFTHLWTMLLHCTPMCPPAPDFRRMSPGAHAGTPLREDGYWCDSVGDGVLDVPAVTSREFAVTQCKPVLPAARDVREAVPYEALWIPLVHFPVIGRATSGRPYIP